MRTVASAATVSPRRRSLHYQTNLSFYEMSHNIKSSTAASARMDDRGPGATRGARSPSGKGSDGERTAGSPPDNATAKGRSGSPTSTPFSLGGELGEGRAAGHSLKTATANVLVNPNSDIPGRTLRSGSASRPIGSCVKDLKTVIEKFCPEGELNYSQLLEKGERFGPSPHGVVLPKGPPSNVSNNKKKRKKKRGRASGIPSPEDFSVPLLAKERSVKKKRCPIPALSESDEEICDDIFLDKYAGLSEDDWNNNFSAFQHPDFWKGPEVSLRNKSMRVEESSKLIFSASPGQYEGGHKISNMERLSEMDTMEVGRRALSWLDDNEAIRAGSDNFRDDWSSRMRSRNDSIGRAIQILMSRANEVNRVPESNMENEELKKQARINEEEIVRLNKEVESANDKIKYLQAEVESLKKRAVSFPSQVHPINIEDIAIGDELRDDAPSSLRNEEILISASSDVETITRRILTVVNENLERKLKAIQAKKITYN